MRSEVGVEYARALEAFARPALKLLHSKWAPFRVAVLSAVFADSDRLVPADQMHVHAGALVESLAADGHDTPPGLTGRDLCRQWVKEQWLHLGLSEAGDEQYSLTSHALEALEVIDHLARDRVVLSESRLTSIVDAVRRWALEASPDVESKVARLDRQIQDLKAQRERLVAGEDVLGVSDDRMLEGYANLVNLVAQLPSDFRRVEESMREMQRRLLDEFRDGNRPLGDVIGDYLTDTDSLLTGTPEGKAFEGAFTVLRDDTLLAELRENTDIILGHPSAEVLTDAEKSGLRSVNAVLRSGVHGGLRARARLSSTLRDQVQQYDRVKERELDGVFRVLDRLFGEWMTATGPRTRVPLDLLPDRVDLDLIRTRLYDPVDDLPPAPLETITADQVPATVTLEELRQWGGPNLPRIEEVLVETLAAGGNVRLDELFNDLPAADRRPVEVIGFLHVLARHQITVPAEGVSVFEAVRPDGTPVTFAGPVLIVERETVSE